MYTILEKRIYCIPEIRQIKLDNEISLVLVSGDPEDPYTSNTPEYFNANQLKDNLA